MAAGHSFLFSVVKSGNKVYLNRIKEFLFNDKAAPGESMSEKQLYQYFTKHVLDFRTLPSPTTLRAAGIEYADTDQPPEYYVQELKKRAVYNAFKTFGKEVTPLLQADFAVDSVYEALTKFSSVVSDIEISDQYKTMVEIGKEIEAQIETRKNGTPEAYVPFGWKSLDDATGGLSGGDLAYFIARPGVGKTNIMTYAAHHAWTQGFSPMLLTMEMTDIQISRRIYGLEGQFNPDAIRRGIPEQIVEQKLGAALESFNTGKPFHVICGQTKQTVESITALVDELRPDVLYIDAAYLVSMNGPSKSAWEKIAAVSERLKQVAISRNIPIIMTVQFNRDAAKSKRFELDTIAGSDAIGQLASVVVAIREGEDSYKETRRVLSIIKNREGAITEFEINNRFNPPDFTEIEGGASNLNSGEEESFEL